MDGTETEAEPLTVDAKWLAKKMTLSLRTIRTRDAAGELPDGHKFGRRRLWYLAEIKQWMAAGMPDREAWNRRKAAKPR